MVALEEQKCVPCEGNVDPLKEDEIQALKPQIPDWSIFEDQGHMRIKRTYAFPDFASALAFTNKVGDAAEAAGHHPVLTTTWGETTVTWWTHAINGLHKNDFIMAAKCDRIAEAM